MHIRARMVLSGLLSLVPLVGCTGAGEPSPTPTSDEAWLTGIWNADVQYQTYNGSPYFAAWPMPARFEPNGSTWDCTLGGLAAKTCSVSVDAASFAATTELVTQYSTYVRTRTFEFRGLEAPEAGQLIAAFTMTYVYDYPDGTQKTNVYTGEAHFHRVDRYDADESRGLRLLGEFGTFGGAARSGVQHVENPTGSGSSDKASSSLKATANVRVEGDFAYLARFGAGLSVLNIADPTRITEVGSAHPDSVGAWYYNDIKLLRQGSALYALLADSRLGLVVYDVTDPTQPLPVSTFYPDLLATGDSLNNHTIFVEGNIAYLGLYEGSVTFDPSGEGESGGLLIVDLSDPSDPQELGRWHTREVGGTFTHDLFVENGIAYLSCWEAGLVVLDVRTPEQPEVLGQFTYERMSSHSVWVTQLGERRVAAHGDEDFGSHLRLVDVDPESPEFMQEIGSFELRPQVSIHNIMAIGSEVVAAHYQDGLRVFDISDPTAPRHERWFNTWRGMEDPDNGSSFYEGGIGVDVVEDRIYLADIWRGLLIFERE